MLPASTFQWPPTPSGSFSISSLGLDHANGLAKLGPTPPASTKFLTGRFHRGGQLPVLFGRDVFAVRRFQGDTPATPLNIEVAVGIPAGPERKQGMRGERSKSHIRARPSPRARKSGFAGGTGPKKRSCFLHVCKACAAPLPGGNSTGEASRRVPLLPKEVLRKHSSKPENSKRAPLRTQSRAGQEKRPGGFSKVQTTLQADGPKDVNIYVETSRKAPNKTQPPSKTRKEMGR